MAPEKETGSCRRSIHPTIFFWSLQAARERDRCVSRSAGSMADSPVLLRWLFIFSTLMSLLVENGGAHQSRLSSISVRLSVVSSYWKCHEFTFWTVCKSNMIPQIYLGSRLLYWWWSTKTSCWHSGFQLFWVFNHRFLFIHTEGNICVISKKTQF